MKHPLTEEWMCFLYGETSRAEHGRLAAHLRECADCQGRVQGWRGAMHQLEHWQVAPSGAGSRRWAKTAQWSAAAAIMICVGFSLGRVFKPTPVNATEMRASIKSEIRKELNAEASNQRTEWERYKAQLDQQREEDSRAMLAAFRKLDAERQQELLSLRKDLETVAVLTQAGFQQAGHQIATLGNFSQNGQQLQDH
jgi:hypothetical protein